MAETIRWEAQEYIQREKHAGWYICLGLICAVGAFLAFFFKFWSFGVLIIVSALALVVYSVRPPRVLKYKLNSKGLTEGEKLYAFSDYRAFSVRQEGEICSIIMIPRKRFGMKVTIYFPKEKGEQIVDVLGGRLPMEETKLDFLDRVVAFLRI